MTENDIRQEAEVTDDGDVLPPQIAVEDDVPPEIVSALRTAAKEEPNTVIAPRVTAPDTSDADHIVARFSATYQELPAIENGDVAGWLPPYRAREQFEAVVREALTGTPFDFEAENNSMTVFYWE